jgi:hypothetical protein
MSTCRVTVKRRSSATRLEAVTTTSILNLKDSPRMPSSAPLLHRIDSAIRKNPHSNGRHVFLESAPGKIILRGKVDSFYQKQMVQESLRGLDGLPEIINQLEVEYQ